MSDSPANDRPELVELQLPTDLKAMVLVGIFTLLLLYALYITGEILRILTGVTAYFCGLSDPVLWRSAAFLLNYVPILLALVGLTTFEEAGPALLPAGIFLLIHFAEGEAITPMLLARQFTLNPVVVIIALIFWYWMWGVAGALLAVPMVATFKIICDRIEMLKAIGHFLGTEPRAIHRIFSRAARRGGA